MLRLGNLKSGNLITAKGVVMNIKQIREKLLLTQKELADKLKVSVVTVQRWEMGQVPSFRQQRKIATFCKRNKIYLDTCYKENEHNKLFYYQNGKMWVSKDIFDLGVIEDFSLLFLTFLLQIEKNNAVVGKCNMEMLGNTFNEGQEIAQEIINDMIDKGYVIKENDNLSIGDIVNLSLINKKTTKYIDIDI